MSDADAGAETTDLTSRPGARWVRLLVGIVLLVLGAVLVLRPFTSLAFLIALVVTALVVGGLGELLRRDRDRGAWPWVRCAAYLLAAVLILVDRKSVV